MRSFWNSWKHFCLNSVSFVDGKKFRGGSKAYWIMRAESDKICAEYGLSVIENPGKGKSYAEWKAEQEAEGENPGGGL